MIKIPENQLYIIETLAYHGFESYIVGGCVRDTLLGKIPNDYDITTNALPEDVINIFEKTVPTGVKHGTVTVIINKEPVEVTTFRTESGYSDSRHPDSTQFVTDIKFDLSRRDFTVNAMAYNKIYGLIDLFSGKEDLKMGILRTVGNPNERFKEDALRILRLFRFASQLGFKIEKNTLLSAIKLQNGLEKISRERIFTELFKAVNGKHPQALEKIIESSGLSFINITKVPDFNIIKRCNKTENLAFFAFLHLSSKDIETVLDQLKTSNKLKDYCKVLSRLTAEKIPEIKAEIKEMLNISSPEIFRDYIELLSAFGNNVTDIENLFDEIIKNKEPYRIKDLKISGDDLKKIGYKGTEIGEVLEKLRKFVVENPDKNTKTTLIQNL